MHLLKTVWSQPVGSSWRVGEQV